MRSEYRGCRGRRGEWVRGRGGLAVGVVNERPLFGQHLASSVFVSTVDQLSRNRERVRLSGCTTRLE